MYWKMYADYRKEHIITTGMCTPRLAEIAHCEIRNLHSINPHFLVKKMSIIRYAIIRFSPRMGSRKGAHLICK